MPPALLVETCLPQPALLSSQLWDTGRKELVQEVGGIRKWNAPNAICYVGYEKCLWVRDATLCELRWRAPPPPPAANGNADG